MSKELIKTESMSLTADRGRMIQTLKRSRLSDRYAYVRNILASASERKATQLNIYGTPSKIIIRDNGEGIEIETLDEKLATIFTNDEMDELAGGILSSFDGNVEEVLIESFPEHGEPYQRSIYSDDEDEICADEPIPLEGKLSKGTRITLYKKSALSLAPGDLWHSIKNTAKSRGIPELRRIRDACRNSQLDVRVNLRKVASRTKKPKCIVSVDIDGEVSGKVGLIRDTKVRARFDRSCHTYTTADSLIYAYRKGLFHGILPQSDSTFSTPHGPIFAELNYNKLKVDIGGKSLREDKNIKPLHKAVASAVPELYRKLLKQRKSPERRDHLLHYQALFTSSLVQIWNEKMAEKRDGLRTDRIKRQTDGETCSETEYEEMLREERNFQAVTHDRISAAGLTSIALEEEYQDINKAVVKEKLYPTKHHGKVSLEFLLEEMSKGKEVFLDHRGYDYESVPEGGVVVRPGYTDEIIGPLLSQFNKVKVLKPQSGLGSRIGGRWYYNNFSSKEAQTKREKRDLLEDKLRIPLLYRPAQMGLAMYDVLLQNFINNLGKEDCDYFESAMGLVAIGIVSPALLAMGMGISVARGGVETVLMAKEPIKSIGAPLVKTTKRMIAAYRRGERPKLLEATKRNYQSVKENNGGTGMEGSSGNQSTGLMVRDKNESLALRVGKMAAGGALVVGTVGIGVGIAGLYGTYFIGKTCAKGIALPLVYGWRGVGACVYYAGEFIEDKVEKVAAKMQKRKTRKLLLKEAIKEGRRNLEHVSDEELKDMKTVIEERRAKRKWTKENSSKAGVYFNKFRDLITALSKEYPFTSKGIQLIDKDYAERLKENLYFPIFSGKTRDPFQDGEERIFIVKNKAEVKRLIKEVGKTEGQGNLKEYLGSLIIDEGRIDTEKTASGHAARLNEVLRDNSPGANDKPGMDKPGKERLFEDLKDVSATMRKYHTDLLDDRMEYLYSSLVEEYNSNHSESFMKGHNQLDKAGKLDLLYRVLAEPRQEEIDTLLESDPASNELLDEAGRKLMREESRRRELEESCRKYFQRMDKTRFLSNYSQLPAEDQERVLRGLLDQQEPRNGNSQEKSNPDQNPIISSLIENPETREKYFSAVNSMEEPQDDFELHIDI